MEPVFSIDLCSRAADRHALARTGRVPSMARTVEGEVLYVVEPDELDEADLEPALAELADARYVLVCREGGRPSWFERVVSFLRRRPIRAVTLVSEERAEVGEEITREIRETDLAGVYETMK